jgi:hypothetical protein
MGLGRAVPRSCRFTSGKGNRYPLYRMFGKRVQKIFIHVDAKTMTGRYSNMKQLITARYILVNMSVVVGNVVHELQTQ